MEFFNLFGKRLVRLLGNAEAADGDSAVDIGRIDPIHIAKGCGVAFFSAVLGLSKGVFSCYPFGLGFLCAINRYIPYSFAGLIVSALFSKGYALALIIVYTVSLMLRYALGRLAEEGTAGEKAKHRRKFSVRLLTSVNELKGSGQVFDESVLIRCTAACFAAFVFGLYRLIEGGFLYFDLFGLISGFFITPLSALVLSAMFCENEQLYKFREVSRGALMFITVFALRDFSLFGLTLSFIGAAAVTIWTASSVGALRGCTAGLIAGLACAGASTLYSPGSAPCILAVVGLCCGLVKNVSIGLGAASGAIAGLAVGMVVNGYTVLGVMFPDVFAATVMFLALFKCRLLPSLPIFVSAMPAKSNDGGYILAKKQSDAEVRITALSEAFSNLSETVYALSDRLRRPGVIDLKNVCTECFDGYCKKCAMASHCLERDCASTLDAQSKITAELYSKGRIEVDDVPKFLRNRCYNIIPITESINRAVGQLVEQLIKNDKTEAFALDYDVMSALLAEQISANEQEYRIDEELTKKLRRTAEHLGLPTSGALCYGSRRKQVVIGGVEMIRLKMGANELRRAVENTLGMPMSEPKFGIEDDSVTVSMAAKRRYSCAVAKASSVKEDESANGDSAVMFENREDYFYALISDGMGSGREAAITSKICVTFAKNMLAAGNGKAVTLKMLNGFIRSRGTECSATVDLAEIDLIHGEACFVKSGAAPSFVVRGGSLYKLQSTTVPIGIMDEIDAEKIKFSLKHGDVLIMMSDGITQSLEDGVWLANLITYEWDERLDAMAEKILDNAAFANKRSDDMTVVLVRVTECEEE